MGAITPETKRKVVELRLGGHAAKDVAGRFGISYRTIEQSWRKWAAELDIELPKGYVRKKKNFHLPKVPPAVWAMRERAVRVRLEGRIPAPFRKRTTRKNGVFPQESSVAPTERHSCRISSAELSVSRISASTGGHGPSIWASRSRRH